MISEADLILSPEGRIYHLDLLPDDIADTIITVGDPMRVRRVSRYFDRIEFTREHREFVTHTGTLRGKRISVVSTGIGPDNIDIALNELDALVNVDLKRREPHLEHRTLTFIRIGTSGSLQPDIPVDKLVASEAAFGIDNLMHFYTGHTDNEGALANFNDTVLDHSWIKAYYYEADDTTLKKFGWGMDVGTTVTCPGFYAPQGRKLRYGPRDKDFIHKLTNWRYNKHRITNFEMETAAIYGLSRLYGHRALSLSAIVANRSNGTFSKKPHDTIELLIQTTLERF